MALRRLAVRLAPPSPTPCRRSRTATPRAAAATPAASRFAHGSAAASEPHVVSELRSACERHALLRRGDTVLACVSGGCDSVALLLALACLAPELSLSLHVLHFNHAIRPESVEEARAVAHLAASLRLPFHLRAREAGGACGDDGAAQAAWGATGVPAAARAWRRSEALALATTLTQQRRAGADSAGGSMLRPARIALAHHADDQRETLLLKLLRGVHASRVAGIAPLSGPFIRPFLTLTKADLQAFLRAEGVPWSEDASNADARYSRRNAVRLRLVPLLNELSGGGLDARLADAVHQSAALRAWLDATPRAWADEAGGGNDADLAAAAASVDAARADGDIEEEDGDGWALDAEDAARDDVAQAAPPACLELDIARRAPSLAADLCDGTFTSTCFALLC
jgi:tRNA(Ile)-lysidine synthase